MMKFASKATCCKRETIKAATQLVWQNANQGAVDPGEDVDFLKLISQASYQYHNTQKTNPQNMTKPGTQLQTIWTPKKTEVKSGVSKE